MKTFLRLALFLTCAFALSAFADIGGKWTTVIDTPMGKQDTTFDFKVDGGTLTGTSTAEMTSSLAIQNGKVAGDDVSFIQTASFGGMEIKFNYKGKISGY